MIPGKSLQPGDIVTIAWRFKWALVIPIAALGAGTALVSWRLPNKYQSQALILIVPPQVPESFVRPTVTSRIEDRLQAISQDILSRTRLEKIILDFDLYREARRTTVMEDVVEQMRTDIDLQIAKRSRRDDGSSVQVSYTARDPKTAQQVTERLVSLFIQENLRDRQLLAESTDQFLEAQLNDARQTLVEQENRLEAYRKSHQGELPTQLSSNLQMIQTTQMQIQTLLESIDRDRDRQHAVERLLADAAAEPETAALPASRQPAPARAATANDGLTIQGATAAEQLESAKNVLKSLQLRLKPQHPDIIRVKRTIDELEQKAEVERAARSSTATEIAATPAQSARRSQISEMRAERENLERQIARKQEEEKKLRDLQGAYQARVEAAPTRESEMTSLMRDYDTLQKSYTNLLAKKEDSQIAANLERRQIGEQFKILDPARLPEKPIWPNRAQINLVGTACGFFIGLGLTALFAYRDTSMRSSGDVLVALALPVLAMIPLLETAAEQRRLQRKRVVVALTAISAVVTLAGLVWKFAS